MICYKCQVENEPGAHYCKQCGTDLWVAQVQKDDGARRSLIHVLILLGWEYFTYLFWFVLQQAISRWSLFSRDYKRISVLYKGVSWTFGGIELVLLITFMALAKNMTARICLLVFMVLRVLLLILYATNWG